MSKAFTKETDQEEAADLHGPDRDGPDIDEPEQDEGGAPLPPARNYMTPAGHAALEAELRWLLREERPRIVEIVSWAAGNGDRSENGDYLYNKKRLREIDRRARYLTKRLENAEIVDPRKQQGIDRVFFGATVTYIRDDGTEKTVTLVGVDEADLEQGKINWQSPVGRALMKAQAGDEVEVRLETGRETIEVLAVRYIV